MLSVQEALDQLLSHATPITQADSVGTLAAAGRVLAESIHAGIDVPPADNAAMDGYALRSQEYRPGTLLPVGQRVAAGALAIPLAPGSAARIFTGAPLPQGADTVVMQEHCRVEADGVAFLRQPAPGEHVRRRGEDIRAGSVLLAAGARLRPQELAYAAAAGLAKLHVVRRPRVAMLFTGAELAMPGGPLAPGQIYNANRYALGALLHALGCETTDFGIVPDRLDATRATLREAAAGHDLVISSGGVSVGEEDHVKAAVSAEGTLEVWKVAMKPGKPLAFGALRRPSGGSAHFIGLPGNPVASFVAFVQFARPFILRMQGVARAQQPALPMRAGFARAHPDARTEFLRVRVGAGGLLEPVGAQGSALLHSLVQADGLAVRAPGRAIAHGDFVPYLPFAELLA